MEPQKQKVETQSVPADVPVFNCIVYVRSERGCVQARVANLSGLTCTAISERAALSEIVPAFKKRVAELTQNGLAIPWVVPPTLAEPGEQTRLIPVHL